MKQIIVHLNFKTNKLTHAVGTCDLLERFFDILVADDVVLDGELGDGNE